MPRVLYTSQFSPFGRKVALALALKGLEFETVDALERDFRPRLLSLNARAEVPVLDDDGLVVVNSCDILQYLELRYPAAALYPADIAERVAARALERLADQRLDPIVVDCSFWTWADRNDAPPPGLREAGQRDLDAVLEKLEAALRQRTKPWPFGAPSVVECAWFPNLAGARPLGFGIDETRFPETLAWLAAMRAHPSFAADARATAAFMKALPASNHERRKLFWSGERMEWLMGRGFHAWLVAEIEAGRAVFPD
jgi:glutathione S-transferase